MCLDKHLSQIYSKVNLVKQIHQPLKGGETGYLRPKRQPWDNHKKAYKGSAIVVMNTSDYLREGYRQLQDDKFYTKIKETPPHMCKKEWIQYLIVWNKRDSSKRKTLNTYHPQTKKQDNSTCSQKSTKREYLGDQSAVLLNIQQPTPVNLLIHI